jgi:hypothetical protein
MSTHYIQLPENAGLSRVYYQGLFRGIDVFSFDELMVIPDNVPPPASTTGNTYYLYIPESNQWIRLYNIHTVHHPKVINVYCDELVPFQGFEPTTPEYVPQSPEYLVPRTPEYIWIDDDSDDEIAKVLFVSDTEVESETETETETEREYENAPSPPVVRPPPRQPMLRLRGPQTTPVRPRSPIRLRTRVIPPAPQRVRRRRIEMVSSTPTVHQAKKPRPATTCDDHDEGFECGVCYLVTPEFGVACEHGCSFLYCIPCYDMTRRRMSCCPQCRRQNH